MEQCREVYSALVHTVPDLWMRRGFSLCYYKQHTPSMQHGQASTGTRGEQEVPSGSGRGAGGALMGEGGEKPHKSHRAKPLSRHDQSCPSLTNHSLARGTVGESNSAVLSRKETTDHRAPRSHLFSMTQRAQEGQAPVR